MLCRNPFVDKFGTAAYPCGQCMPCRFNKRRLWTHRLMLEAGCHVDSTFVTLTYSDDYLPSGSTLVKEHVQKWLKRLREQVAPARLRYYAVGEYGDRGGRPHYHAALFGFPSCSHGQTLNPGRADDCCEWCNIVFRSWGMGSIKLGTLEVSSAQYICGYVTKKLTNANDDVVRSYLGSRSPEFAIMSNRPGIGCLAMDDVASVLLKYDPECIDVPVGLSHGRRRLPLGRYLRRQLRKRIGRDEKAPVCKETQEEMLRLRILAKKDKDLPSLKSQVIKDGNQRYLQFNFRQSMKKERKRL